MPSASERDRTEKGKTPAKKTASTGRAGGKTPAKKTASTGRAGGKTPVKKSSSPARTGAKATAGAPPLDEDLYKGLFHSSARAMAVLRLLRDDSGTPLDLLVVDATEAFGQTMGVSDHIGRTLSELTPGYRDEKPDLVDACARVAGTGIPEDHESYHPRLERWTYLRIRPTAAEDHLMVIAADISDTVATSEALERSKFLLDHMRDYPLWTDSEGKIVEVSESTCRALEYTREELLSMSVFDISPTLRPEYWRKNWRLLRGPGATPTVKTTHLTKTGRTLPVELSTNLITYGKDEYHCALCRDITDRKQADAALHRLRHSMDSLRDDYPTWNDAEGRIIEVSESTCRALEYTREELLGMTIFDICPELNRKAWKEAWDANMQRDSFRIEVHHRTKSGRFFPVEVTVNPMVFEGKEYHCTFCRDITERRQMEESLRIMQLSVDGAPDMIHWLDSEGRILYANRATCEFLGYSQDELRDMRIWDVTVGLTPGAYKEKWDKAASGVGYLGKDTLRSKAGREYTVEIAAAHVHYEGREVGIAFVRDLTEREETLNALREREEQLRQSQKMEAVGRLAGGIAHDFNNVLTTIIGYSDLILSSSELPDGSLLEDVGEIKAAAERAGALTRRVLAFSRRQSLQPTVVSLNSVVSDTEKLLSRTLGADMELRTSLDPKLCNVKVDEHQFVQALLNLAVNARDAMPDGGTLTLATSNVELDEEFCSTHLGTQQGPYAALTVSDTGMGMDQDTLLRVFEPFYTTKPPGEGTGLGLSTVYGFVTQSNGYVDVQSKPSEGTTFTIYLPRTDDQPEEGDPSTAATETETAPPTVMLVEDDATFASVIERILQRQGYKVVATTDMKRAQSLLRDDEVRVDALLVGLAPDDSSVGEQAAHYASEWRPRLPILFMSSRSRDTMVESGKVDTDAVYLEKPFTAEELATQMRTCLGDN